MPQIDGTYFISLYIKKQLNANRGIGESVRSELPK